MGKTTGRSAKQGPLRGRGVVALSAAAILAVYAAGYARTAPAAGQLAAAGLPASAVAAAPPPPTATATAAPPSTAPPPPVVARGAGAGQAPVAPAPTTQPTATPRPTVAPTAPAAAYRDGTYHGTGTSRHGNIGVTVTVQGGRIAAAQITTCGTRYPCSEIAALPGQVLARQGPAVDYVSGATDSSSAYRAAVTAALAQAR